MERKFEEVVRVAVEGLDEEGDIVEAVRESGALQACVDEIMRTSEDVKKAIVKDIIGLIEEGDLDISDAIINKIPDVKITSLVKELLEKDEGVRNALAQAISEKVKDEDFLADMVTEEDISAGIGEETIRAKIKSVFEQDKEVQGAFNKAVSYLLKNSLESVLGESEEFERIVTETILQNDQAKVTLANAVKTTISQGMLDQLILRAMEKVDLSDIISDMMNDPVTQATLRSRIQQVAEKEIRSIRLDQTSLSQLIQTELLTGLEGDSTFKRRISQGVDEAMKSGRVDQKVKSTLQELFSEGGRSAELTSIIRDVAIKVVSETILGLKNKI